MTLSPKEIAQVMTIFAGADTRFPAPAPPRPDGVGGMVVDPRIEAWRGILAEARFEDVWEAALRLCRRGMLQVVQPGHVLDEVRVLRAERLRAVSDADLVPPVLPEGGFVPWLREARRGVADGLPVAEAVARADSVAGGERRELGPPVGRPVLDALGNDR